LKTNNPSPDWISERVWNEILTLESLKVFKGISSDFKNHLEAFKEIFDSSEPHRQKLPEPWSTKLDSFQHIIILKCLRPDKVTNAMQDYVANNIGQRFIEPQV
jgi:dynein heavy chain, axonemal